MHDNIECIENERVLYSLFFILFCLILIFHVCLQQSLAIRNAVGMCEFWVGYMMHIKPANTTIEIDGMLEICFV